MLNKAFAWIAGVAATAATGAAIAALQGSQSNAGRDALWATCAVGGLLACVCAIGWLLTRDSSASSAVTSDIRVETHAAGSGAITVAPEVRIASPDVVGSYNTTNIATPTAAVPTPTVAVQAQDRVLWLTITNNGDADQFSVRVWAFGQSNVVVVPTWQDGQQEVLLRRGEWASIRILEVEPGFLRPVAGAVSIVAKIAWEHAQPQYEKRVADGTRLVRFVAAGQEFASRHDIAVPINAEQRFTLRVLSHRQDPVDLAVSYVVSEHTKLLTPYESATLDRANEADAKQWAELVERARRDWETDHEQQPSS